MRDAGTRWLATLSLALAAAAGVARWRFDETYRGMDFAMLCTSAALVESGGNPYDHDALVRAGGVSTPVLTAPPLLVRAFAPLCNTSPLIAALGAGFIVALIVWRGLAVPLSLAATITGSAFAALPWVAYLGNHALFEGIAIAVAVVAVVRDQPRSFGAAIGAAAFAKSLTPLIFLLGAVRWPRRRATVAVVTGIGAVIALHAVDWMLDARLASAYWHTYRHEFAGWVALELEQGTEYNPSLFALIPDATRFVGLSTASGMVFAAIIAAGFLTGWLRLWARVHSDSGAERVPLALLLIGVLALVQPRLKPYSFFLLTPVAAYFIAQLPGRLTWRALALVCAVPNLFLLVSSVLTAAAWRPRVVGFLVEYSQWWTAALAAGVIMVMTAGRNGRLNTKGRIV